LPFRQRFLLSVLIPGALASITLALLYLAQILQISGRAWAVAIPVVIFFYLAGCSLFAILLMPALRDVEAAVDADRNVSEVLSACLQRTMLLTNVLWLGGGLLFAIIGSVVLMPTAQGFTLFVVAMLVAAAPSMAWSYIAAKRALIAEGRKTTGLRYVGRLFPIARKISLVFIAFFIIAVAALIQLVSAKVSHSLENLAVRNASPWFAETSLRASKLPAIGAPQLAELSKGIPSGHDLMIVRPNGVLLNPRSTFEGEAALTKEEINRIQRMRSGDTSQFISDHVAVFHEVAAGNILVMTIPWSMYADIPRQIGFYTGVIALVTTLLFAAATYFLSRDITYPVRQLMEVSQEMARGNFSVQTRLFSDDEVGNLVVSFAETRDNLRSLLGRMGGSGATITDGVKVITGGTDTLLKLSAQQSDISANSTAAIGNVRKGAESVLQAAEKVTDLSHDAASRAVELQASAEEVARSMDYLFQSVDKTSSSTTEMDAAAHSMTQRTDLLANISEEVLTFVAEMDSTIEELRRTAISTADVSREVREDAAAGGEAVRATVAGISEAQTTTEHTSRVLDELHRSIGEISQILTAIEEITDRTNLLSLNAAIIAAQAGEQGASFTVVANEIRQLADRTRGATKDISGIIKAVQSRSKEASNSMREGVARVAQNVTLTQNASLSLDKILASADKSYGMANQIASALEQQADASRHLHQVTSRMSDSISEINRSTQEQARGTRMMTEEAERVREIALQVKNATEQQSVAGLGIASAMEQIAADVMHIRDLLERQLQETERIGQATSTILRFAQENNQVAQDFTTMVQGLVRSGREFETEVNRFRLTS
jgi:methyl-accepting chemotaxis protein